MELPISTLTLARAGTAPADPCRLPAGELLYEADGMGPLWQLEAGALRLDRMTREGGRFVQLALPGDLLGLEQLLACPYTYSARALVPSQLRRRTPVGEAERRLVMAEGLLQQQRRGEDLVLLRTGTAQDRLKHLLLLLAPPDDPWRDEAVPRALPTIKDMAAILDTAPETVSRIFANLRRTQLLDERQRQGASFSPARLRESDWPAGMTRSDGGAATRVARRVARPVEAA